MYILTTVASKDLHHRSVHYEAGAGGNPCTSSLQWPPRIYTTGQYTIQLELEDTFYILTTVASKDLHHRSVHYKAGAGGNPCTSSLQGSTPQVSTKINISIVNKFI